MKKISRRDALRMLGAAGGGLALSRNAADAESALAIIRGKSADIKVAGIPVEIAVWSLSPTTARISVRPLTNEQPAPIPFTGALVEEEPGEMRGRGRDGESFGRVEAGNLVVRFTDEPPTVHIETRDGKGVQRLTLNADATGMSFLLPKGPLLGLGEGGAQFDRKGVIDTMRNGQGASQREGPGEYELSTHGTRAPIQWLVGTDGWAMFIHQPYGAFDFTGTEGRFMPQPPRRRRGQEATPQPAEPEQILPLDVFIVASQEPREIMREYARITGLPEMPARWTLGYQQSSRTLAGRDEIMGVAHTMREKKMPCDALIYLGTEFAPSGWNTRNGEFTWHPENFPDPKAMLDELHSLGFKVIVHVVVEGRRLIGTVHDECTAEPLPSGRTADNRWPPERQVACYWPAHKAVMDVGVDGWWPDQGDGFDGPSRLNRHRMYWEGTQMYRPNVRPFALHRNASAGVQRYGGFIWSGDTRAFWETLKNHVPIAINTGLSGLPYWGSDIGGFNPTPEYTAELHVRWFQFGAFCPSFRAHGRNWHVKLPWGWNGGDGGPDGDSKWRPAPGELNKPESEAILKQYLELRSRMMPYLYTAVRETHETGMPIMRAMWLHHPDDAVATARGDQFYWGPDIVVAPVVEKSATSRNVYLPRGAWFDFWTGERVSGGRDVTRAVDLATTPMYVRAGAVLPIGPVKQYADELTDEPVELVVYPGANGTSYLYDDDGISFDHKRGEWMRIVMNWQDDSRTLTLQLAPGSRMLEPQRRFNVRLVTESSTRPITFTGAALDLKL